MAAHYHNIHWGTHFNTLILSPPSVHNKCSESCCAVILCTGVRSFPRVFISLITLISRHWLLHTIAYIAHTTTGASAPWMHRSSDSGWFNRYIKFLNNFGHLNLYTLSCFILLVSYPFAFATKLRLSVYWLFVLPMTCTKWNATANQLVTWSVMWELKMLGKLFQM